MTLQLRGEKSILLAGSTGKGVAQTALEHLFAKGNFGSTEEQRGASA